MTPGRKLFGKHAFRERLGEAMASVDQCARILSYRTVQALALLGLFVTYGSITSAQTIDDGWMVGRKVLFAGVLYTHDSWDHYWEGALNRVNGNLGTVTAQTTHYTLSAAAAEVLSYLFPQAADFFASQRDEAAMSRLFGGIHYPSDISVGMDHGKRVGDYTVRFAQNDGAN